MKYQAMKNKLNKFSHLHYTKNRLSGYIFVLRRICVTSHLRPIQILGLIAESTLFHVLEKCSFMSVTRPHFNPKSLNMVEMAQACSQTFATSSIPLSSSVLLSLPSPSFSLPFPSFSLPFPALPSNPARAVILKAVRNRQEPGKLHE